MSDKFDSILVLSFGGPDKPEDVMPFLENVLRGRNVPKERMLEVAEHYYHFGGKSPINDQNLELIAALKELLAEEGPDLPIYFGNRNWHPFLPDTLKKMKDDGKKNALAFFTSIFSSYSGCRQYRENVLKAQEEIGEGAPQVTKVRMSYNHPLFIEAMQERVQTAKESLPAELADNAVIIFTAHSIPLSMAKGCAYEIQLRESSKLVAAAFPSNKYKIAYQSRSGAPHIPWLEPDVSDVIAETKKEGAKAVIVVPIGFVSDHMEVIYDLDNEAKETAEELGLAFARAKSAGTHPKFVRMIRDLILERYDNLAERPALGTQGACHDVCPKNCCMPGQSKPDQAKPASGGCVQHS